MKSLSSTSAARLSSGGLPESPEVLPLRPPPPPPNIFKEPVKRKLRVNRADKLAPTVGPRSFVCVGRTLPLVTVDRLAAELRVSKAEAIQFLEWFGVPLVPVGSTHSFNLLELVRVGIARTTRPLRAYGAPGPDTSTLEWTEDELDARLWWFFNCYGVTRRRALLQALEDSSAYLREVVRRSPSLPFPHLRAVDPAQPVREGPAVKATTRSDLKGRKARIAPKFPDRGTTHE